MKTPICKYQKPDIINTNAKKAAYSGMQGLKPFQACFSD